MCPHACVYAREEGGGESRVVRLVCYAIGIKRHVVCGGWWVAGGKRHVL